MLNKKETNTIENTIDIIQAEIEKIFAYHKGFRKSPNFFALEHSCNKIRVLIECRNRLQGYFLNGID